MPCPFLSEKRVGTCSNSHFADQSTGKHEVCPYKGMKAAPNVGVFVGVNLVFTQKSTKIRIAAGPVDRMI
jgi:hypothetical protein